MSTSLSVFVAKQVERLSEGKNFAEFDVGDTIVVKSKITDSKGGERLQTMEGLCIAVRNRGLGSSFLLRKTAHGVSMEKRFMRYSPLIESITLIKKGVVRRAKLYYMRSLQGKKARVRQDINYVGGTKIVHNANH
jgi:large subunit ribosomal protein L19